LNLAFEPLIVNQLDSSELTYRSFSRSGFAVGCSGHKWVEVPCWYLWWLNMSTFGLAS